MEYDLQIKHPVKFGNVSNNITRCNWQMAISIANRSLKTPQYNLILQKRKKIIKYMDSF